LKVLIIDDQQPNVMLLSVLVKRLGGIDTQDFFDALLALEWCKNNDPDLVLIDYMMPNMDGIEFIQKFRTLPGKVNIPVVMITADSDIEVRHKALEATANDFLNKPINSTELTTRVKNMLALRKAQLQLSNKAAWLAEEVKKATEQIIKTEREVIIRLARAAEYKDPETGTHIQRMSQYAGHIAKNLGLSEEEQQLIIDAAPMHDIGKIGIPDSVLLKPGRLDADELKVIYQHPTYGKQMLTGSSSKLLQAAEVIAYSHHEKFDGSGYPQGLAGNDIPIYGRIVALADVFDALSSARPYKVAWEIDKTIAFIKEQSGKHFDPKCVDAFFENWENVLSIKEHFIDEI
jgi:response regulator RpfG family c-di-GMP phosphodiesterase